MGKIKVGELVRTVFGDIYKVENLNNYEFLRDKFYNCIVKHSKNIIDLIEVGDYVNGKLIHKIDKRPNYCYLYYGNCKTFVDYQIKNIVTKERFARESYKVEEGQDV